LTNYGLLVRRYGADVGNFEWDVDTSVLLTVLFGV